MLSAPGSAPAPRGQQKLAREHEPPHHHTPGHTHHQNSSTVWKVKTGRSVCPYLLVDCFCCGLSNHSVHAYSRGCRALKSGDCCCCPAASAILLPFVGGAAAAAAATAAPTAAAAAAAPSSPSLHGSTHTVYVQGL